MVSTGQYVSQSADDFSERSLRMAEVSRDQRNLEEEEEEEDASPIGAKKCKEGFLGLKIKSMQELKWKSVLKMLWNSNFIFTIWEMFLLHSLLAVNGEAEHLDFIDSSLTEEEEIRMDPPSPSLNAPYLVEISPWSFQFYCFRTFQWFGGLEKNSYWLLNWFPGADAEPFSASISELNSAQVQHTVKINNKDW